MMSYLELEISGIMEGYRCAQRSSVGDCPKFVEEMKALAVKHPQNSIIRLHLMDMGVKTSTHAGSVESHGAHHVVL